MAKTKQFKIKGANGEYQQAVELAADAVNVDLSSGAQYTSNQQTIKTAEAAIKDHTARIGVAEGKIGADYNLDEDGTISSRLDALETTVDTSETGLSARVGTLEGHVGKAGAQGSGLLKDVENLEAEVGTHTGKTGSLNARLNTIEGHVGAAGVDGSGLLKLQTEVGARSAGKTDTLNARVDSIEDDLNPGKNDSLAKKVSELDGTVNKASTGLVPRVTALEGKDNYKVIRINNGTTGAASFTASTAEATLDMIGGGTVTLSQDAGKLKISSSVSADQVAAAEGSPVTGSTVANQIEQLNQQIVSKTDSEFSNKTVVFNEDGSITETRSTETITTVFNADGSIVETKTPNQGSPQIKTTIFNPDGSISISVVEGVSV